MLEKEYKIMLDKNGYAYVNEAFSWDKDYIQTNYYYDTKDMYMHRNSISFRIREKNQMLRLQAKIPDVLNNDSLYSCKNEHEYEISDIPQSIPSQSVKEYISMETGDVFLLGHLKTYRKEARLDEVLVCLDKNEYLDTVDYELEIEFTGNSGKAMELIKSLRLNVEDNGIGKYTRFINKLK